MKKGDRLDISISVIATEDFSDDDAMMAGAQALRAAMPLLMAHPVKRFTSGVCIGQGIRRHHRVARRRRELSALATEPSGPLQ